MNRSKAGIQKVLKEGACRVCNSHEFQAAHLWPRSLGAKGYNDPDVIVPLCEACHTDFDEYRLELLPYLTRDEEIACVKYAGIARAYKRLTS